LILAGWCRSPDCGTAMANFVLGAVRTLV